MGLSKKLGTTTQKPLTLPGSNAVPYKWSHQTYTVGEILKNFKLPCVVQCATDSCTVLWSDFQFDLRQPLLFYSRRSVQKMHAVSLRQGKDALEEIGPTMAIPEDYEGWFGATPKGINKAKRHFRIAGVANSTARRFVVTTKCPAFTSCRGPDGELKYVPHDVMPGEVLKRVCVVDSDADGSNVSSLVKENGPCMECLDDKDEDVVIPLSRRAVIYEIAELYPEDEECVFQIESAIKAGNSNLPRIITLLHGEPPVLAYTFTGMVRCYSVFFEETLLAATLADPSSRCLELATDSSAKFRLALNEAAVKKTCEYNNALQMCQSFGSRFVTGIKVSFSLKPELSDLDDIDLSVYEGGSDLQEIEANSEFEITWGAVKKARLLMESNALNTDSDSSANEDADALPDLPPKESSEVKDSSSKPKSLEKTVSDSSDSSLPKHRDFTEQEIKDLMLRKGMVAQTGSSEEASQEIESLKENRVTDNPLFYYFQRNPDQSPWKTPDREEDKSPAGESPTPDDQIDKGNPLSYLFEQPPDRTSEKAENENPLAHLFQQSCEQTPVDGKPEIEDFPEDAGNGTEISDELILAQTSPSDLPTDPEISQYDHVVCKAAKEYSEDDNDENEESDADESDLSGDWQPPDAVEKLASHQEVIMQAQGDEVSSDDEILFSDHDQEIIPDSPSFPGPEKTKNVFLALPDGDTREETQTSEYNDESEAVDDLLFLAEMESNKFSSPDSTGSTEKWNQNFHVPPVGSENGQSESQQTRPKSDNPADRLNTLLEEVSSLVNTSSGRILDVKKSPTLQGNRNETCSTSTQVGHNQDYYDTLFQGISVASGCGEPPVTSIKVSETEKMSPPAHSGQGVPKSAADHVSSKKQFDLKQSSSKTPSHDTKSLPKGRKSKVDSAISFYTGLDTKKSKSEDFIGLRRAKVEVNLADVGHKKDKQPTAKELFETFSSESTVSSIFRREKEEQNRFKSSKVKHFPHEHPHRLSQPDEQDGDELNGKPNPAIPYEDEENESSLRTSQRESSLRGKVLASVQNFERLSSASSSISSNRSSSVGSSFRQSSPKLVLISDAGLSVVGKSDSKMVHQPATSLDLRPGEESDDEKEEDSDEDVFKVEQQYQISRSGKVKANRGKRSHRPAVLQRIDSNGKLEDFV